MFKELFDAVIDEKHGGFKAADKHPAPDLDAGKVLSTHTHTHTPAPAHTHPAPDLDAGKVLSTHTHTHTHTLETAAESRGAL